MKTIRVTGKTVEEAVAEGIAQLGISREEAIIHVIEEPSGGLFGLLRRKPAVVDVSCLESEGTQDFLDQLAREGKEAADKVMGRTPEPAPAEEAAETEAPAAAETEAPQAVEAQATAAPEPEAETASKAETAPAAAMSEVDEDEEEEPEADEEGRPARTREPAPFSQEEQNATAEAAKKFLAGVFRGMGLDVTMEKMMNEERILLNLRGHGLGILIGKHGQTLNSLQYLTNLAAGRLYHHRYFVMLDVENYRARREQTLTALARRMADKVKRSGQSLALEPMEPSERRIIHLALQHDPDVITTSEGEGSYRHVIIQAK